MYSPPQKDAVTLYSTVSISIQAIQEVDFKVKIFNLTTVCGSRKLTILKNNLKQKNLKVSMKAEIDELKVLVQQLINETPGRP